MPQTLAVTDVITTLNQAESPVESATIAGSTLSWRMPGEVTSVHWGAAFSPSVSDIYQEYTISQINYYNSYRFCPVEQQQSGLSLQA